MNVTELLAHAEAGGKLAAASRRRVLAHLITSNDQRNQTQLAALFGVTRRIVRLDSLELKRQKSTSVQQKETDNVLGDILWTFEQQARQIEASKRKAELGTRTYLEHCIKLTDLCLKKTMALQTLGFLPKNLGTMSEVKYEFNASIVRDGSKNVRTDQQFEEEGAEIMEGSLIARAEIQEKESAQ